MKYGRSQHPLTFTNWVTTDPIVAPLEPEAPESYEDWMSVDATHIRVTGNWHAGYFVNFHAYPYYPDFLNYPWTAFPVQVRDYNFPEVKTPEDPYATYLELLHAHFPGYPIVITEVGLPTSWGTSKFGFAGRNHGFLNETDAGHKMAAVCNLIYDRGYAGVMVFALTDEWFKKNWNNLKIDYNRKAWHNVYSSEQFFGLVAVEPQTPITIDGMMDDWAGIPPLYSTTVGGGGADADGGGAPTQVDIDYMAVTHDAAFVYVVLRKPNNQAWTNTDHLILSFDGVPNQGSSSWITTTGAVFRHNSDTLLQLTAGTMYLFVHTANDFYLRAYGAWLETELEDPDGLAGDTRHFNVMRLLTKIPAYIGKGALKVFSDYTVQWAGDLLMGTTQIMDDNFNNLAAWAAKGAVLEVRVPWMALGFSDPSQHLNYAMTAQGLKLKIANRPSPGISVQPLLLSQQGAQSPSSQPFTYIWDKWLYTCFCERYKHGAGAIKSMFAHLRSDKQVPYDPSTMMRRDYQHCECVDPYAMLFPYKSWYIAIAVIIVTAFLGYAGLVRPLIERLLPFMTPSSINTPAADGRRKLQFLALLLFLATAGTFFTVWFLRGQPSIMQMLLQFSDTTDLSSTGFFVLYMFLLTWDSLELLLGVLFIRWKDPPPKLVRDADVRGRARHPCWVDGAEHAGSRLR